MDITKHKLQSKSMHFGNFEIPAQGYINKLTPKPCDS